MLDDVMFKCYMYCLWLTPAIQAKQCSGGIKNKDFMESDFVQ